MRGRSKRHHCSETWRGREAPGVGAMVGGGGEGGHKGEGGGETEVEDKMSCILLQIGSVMAEGGVMLRGEECAEMGGSDRRREEEREGAGSSRSKGHTAVCF